MTRTTKTRLGCESLEVRECPALLVGGDDFCGTPYPGPRPLVHSDQIRVAANPVVNAGIIAINPGSVRGFVIEGG